MPTDRIIRFADFELDVERYQLRRAGEQIRLERLPMDLLILLASRHGELISRADIVDRLWHGNPYRDTENGINTAIRKIRIALADDPLKPRHLVTVKGKGYRLDGANFVSTASADAIDPSETPRSHSAVRVLVLPFANLTGDGNQECLCSALADEISATLGALGPDRLRLIARTTAARYRDTAKGIGEIARELKLDYVLEGSLSREGPRARILTRLIRCADEVQIWSRAHEPVSPGALDMLKEVATALAQDLATTLSEQQRSRLARRLPVDPAAHDAYVRGRYFWYRRVHFDAAFCAHHGIDGEDFARSRGYFETALERDPNYALGYAGLSNYYGASVVHGMFSPDDGWPIARALAHSALELDPDLPEAHHALAAVRYFFEWDWARAEAGFKEALRRNPSYPEAHRLYARLLLSAGRRAEGEVEMARAERIDPLAFQGSRAFGMILSGRHEEVVSDYLSPGHMDYSPLAYQVLATAFEVRKLYAQAVDATVEALVRCNLHARAATIRAQWDAGGYDAVLHWYRDDLLARHRSQYTSPLLIAEIYARLAQPDEMFHWLDAALAERSARLCELRMNPWFQPYRPGGRMRKIEQLIGEGRAH
ncbi:DNA-binding winged helix-turn-helix (wHTH) protein [Paraburkholderia eburnea]|uniref:DNA-binding winged helix-turn-helix (WHTH) protein n=1 Tax=Paraburkholderia eburnea TaxID=1189126 RepID=A0A2S4MMM0_9BURK|nr:winged helix-turn-helix domain-containing protein [Paraburkholderia eburnea]POR55996.1 DNA-binding winged helix-turn-helix (wHTH) protein [Paraburkholderia eburnea]PRZ27123.1 DNA-binding winged helix-turn-helix (wHTH) protein [Paraburkholderia eburnea]